MITTDCNPINWMLSKASEYDRRDNFTAYQFKGSVPARMQHEVVDWMKAQQARINDGRSTTSYNLTLEDMIDADRRWYRCVGLTIKRGNYQSTANRVELILTIDDGPISDEDWTEFQQQAA